MRYVDQLKLGTLFALLAAADPAVAADGSAPILLEVRILAIDEAKAHELGLDLPEVAALDFRSLKFNEGPFLSAKLERTLIEAKALKVLAEPSLITENKSPAWFEMTGSDLRAKVEIVAERRTADQVSLNLNLQLRKADEFDPSNLVQRRHRRTNEFSARLEIPAGKTATITGLVRESKPSDIGEPQSAAPRAHLVILVTPKLLPPIPATDFGSANKAEPTERVRHDPPYHEMVAVAAAAMAEGRIDEARAISRQAAACQLAAKAEELKQLEFELDQLRIKSGEIARYVIDAQIIEIDPELVGQFRRDIYVCEALWIYALGGPLDLSLTDLYLHPAQSSASIAVHGRFTHESLCAKIDSAIANGLAYRLANMTIDTTSDRALRLSALGGAGLQHSGTTAGANSATNKVTVDVQITRESTNRQTLAVRASVWPLPGGAASAQSRPLLIPKIVDTTVEVPIGAVVSIFLPTETSTRTFSLDDEPLGRVVLLRIKQADNSPILGWPRSSHVMPVHCDDSEAAPPAPDDL